MFKPGQKCHGGTLDEKGRMNRYTLLLRNLENPLQNMVAEFLIIIWTVKTMWLTSVCFYGFVTKVGGDSLVEVIEVAHK